MRVLVKCGAGIDVHKKMIVACLKRKNKKQELRQFGTNTEELRDM